MKNSGLSNKVVIITGAAVGIGYEIARQLALKGAKVVLNSIDKKTCEDSCFKIKREGGETSPFPGDSSLVKTIDEMLEFTIAKYGQLDIAIANTGITTFGSFLEYSEKSMELLLKTNLFGTFFLAQAAAKQLIAQGKGGSILLTSSVTGHIAHPDLAAYGMTKAGIDQLAKNLIIDLAPHNININTIVPGATLTERTEEDPEYLSNWSKITPSNRPCTTMDIANAALFLVSPDSQQITGQNLVIDGGWTSVGIPPN